MVAQTDERLDSTIKRAILDNESMSQELTWQSRQAQRLVGHNQELERQMTQMRVALGVAKQVEEALVAKNQACERTIAMLVRGTVQSIWAAWPGGGQFVLGCSWAGLFFV